MNAEVENCVATSSLTFKLRDGTSQCPFSSISKQDLLFLFFQGFIFTFWIFNPSKPDRFRSSRLTCRGSEQNASTRLVLALRRVRVGPRGPSLCLKIKMQSLSTLDAIWCHLMPYSPCLLAQRSLLSGALSCLTPFLASQLISSQPRTAKCVTQHKQKDANSFNMNPSFWKTEATGKGVVSHQGNCYDVIYDEFGGPKNMGQLLVRPGYSRLSCGSRMCSSGCLPPLSWRSTVVRLLQSWEYWEWAIFLYTKITRVTFESQMCCFVKKPEASRSSGSECLDSRDKPLRDETMRRWKDNL